MSRKTSKQPRQRERWRAYGLLLPSERIYLKGRRGASWREPIDTSAREVIIREQLASGRTLADAATELLLRGFDLAKPALVRAWLIDYCDRYISLAALRERNRTAIDAGPDRERARIARNVRRTTDQFTHQSVPTRDALTHMFLLANGAAPTPRPRDGMILPDSAPFDWRRLRGLVDAATDARLMQSLANAREQAVADATTCGPQYALCGISPPDVVRGLLPGHVCRRGHTVAEAMLPRATLGQLDTLWTNPDPQWAGMAFLDTLSSGLPLMGEWLHERGR